MADPVPPPLDQAPYQRVLAQLRANPELLGPIPDGKVDPAIRRAFSNALGERFAARLILLLGLIQSSLDAIVSQLLIYDENLHVETVLRHLRGHQYAQDSSGAWDFYFRTLDQVANDSIARIDNLLPDPQAKQARNARIRRTLVELHDLRSAWRLFGRQGQRRPPEVVGDSAVAAVALEMLDRFSVAAGATESAGISVGAERPLDSLQPLAPNPPPLRPSTRTQLDPREAEMLDHPYCIGLDGLPMTPEKLQDYVRLDNFGALTGLFWDALRQPYQAWRQDQSGSPPLELQELVCRVPPLAGLPIDLSGSDTIRQFAFRVEQQLEPGTPTWTLWQFVSALYLIDSDGGGHATPRTHLMSFEDWQTFHLGRRRPLAYCLQQIGNTMRHRPEWRAAVGWSYVPRYSDLIAIQQMMDVRLTQITKERSKEGKGGLHWLASTYPVTAS